MRRVVKANSVDDEKLDEHIESLNPGWERGFLGLKLKFPQRHKKGSNALLLRR